MHPALAPYTFARGGLTVRNRTVLAAMTNKQSHDDGTVSSNEINWLEARSIGGFGIITTAATHVLEHGQGWEGEFGTWSDHHLEGLAAMANAISRHGAIGLAQLFHGGMRAPEALTGLQPRSASVNELGSDLGTSRAMSEQDVREVIDGFGAAARRCELPDFKGLNSTGPMATLSLNFSVQEQTAGPMHGAVLNKSERNSSLKSYRKSDDKRVRTSWSVCVYPLNSRPAA